MRLSRDDLRALKGTAAYYPQGLQRVKKPQIQVRKVGEDTVYKTDSLEGKEFVQEYTGFPNNVLRFNKRYDKYISPRLKKPVALLEYLIKTYSKKGDIILDNCMGSGTTAVALLKYGPVFYWF